MNTSVNIHSRRSISISGRVCLMGGVASGQGAEGVGYDLDTIELNGNGVGVGFYIGTDALD